MTDKDWTWPKGKSFAELTAVEKQLAAKRACAQLEQELQAMAPAISAVLDQADDDWEPCHVCGGDADARCAICDRPVCDDDARMKDYDRFCTVCAPTPAGA
jgi:recombinational DNA repair protein RecR